MGDPAKRNVILDRLFGAPLPGDDPASHSAPRGFSRDREASGAFQPFGYRFEVRSYLPPSHVRAALRAGMKDWFDAKSGARGWIIGPFMCLWFSAFDRYGPMLLATVRRDDPGTRVTGRAGSDLNGLALFTVLVPLLAFALYQMVSAGDYAPTHVIIIGGLILLSPLVFWLSHLDRRRGEPLVRFVQDAVARAEGRVPAASAGATASRPLTLTATGEDQIDPTAEDIHDALRDVDDGDSVILAAGAETYIQTAFRGGDYILERRDGDGRSHVQARRRDDPSEVTFTFEEVSEAFMAYADETPPPDFVVWEPLHLAV